MGLVLALILIILMFGGLPAWGFHNAGYFPSGGLGLLLIVILVLIASGRL